MWYNDLRPLSELTPNQYSLVFIQKDEDDLIFSEEDKKRAIPNIVALKKGLQEKVPPKTVDRNLLLASWNIKEFGHITERLPESHYYIAEIINAFDIVAIQEIKSSLEGLNKVMRLLGSHWSYIITDITEGSAGNKERFGFIYDTRHIQHSGLSGELVIPPEIGENAIIRQLKRTPTITGFEAGWKKFSIISVHLHPGEGGASGDEPSDHDLRKEEVRLLMELIRDKLDSEKLWSDDLIILGDTNLYDDDDDIVDLITDEGFSESQGLEGKPTNTSLSQIYDRIFMNTDDYFTFSKDENGVEKGDVFNLFDYVYTDDLRTSYHDEMLEQKNDPSTLTDDEAFQKYYDRYWKRNQVSDHLPVWIEIETDSSESFLNNKMNKFPD